jgi:hypothetical protein
MGNETGYGAAYNTLPAKYKRMLGVHSVQDLLAKGGATLEVYVVPGVGRPYGDVADRIVGVFTRGSETVCVSGDGDSFRPMKKLISHEFRAQNPAVEKLENVAIAAYRGRRMMQPLGPFC